MGHTLSKNAQTIKDIFENIIESSKRKLNLMETDRGKEFFYKIFWNFAIINNNKHYSRNTSLGAVFAKSFNKTFRDLLE